jgi:sirohydrochlorin cobaltochelatase
LGTVQNQPSGEAALKAVQASGAASVVFSPLLLVAGEHINKDIMGDGPESWKSRVAAGRPIEVRGSRRGLGYQDEVVEIYLDHLAEALKTLNP